MKKKTYLAVDSNCWTPEKIGSDCLGGTEQFFMRLKSWLEKAGHLVFDPVINPGVDRADLCIHSNAFDHRYDGINKHLLWAGSWHASVHDPKADKVIIVSEFMKSQMKCDRAIVIPAPYDHTLDGYKTSDYVKNRIVTTSNPNRHFQHTMKVAELLHERGVEFDLQMVGGNRLYSDKFGECFNFRSSPYINYRGVLPRHDMIGVLTTANVWIYPNFSDQSETMGVAPVEAMVLGIPTVLPWREPFMSIVPEAKLVGNEEHMADAIISVLSGKRSSRENYNMLRYSEDVVMPKILKEVEEML
jgi:hypothetical protein